MISTPDTLVAAACERTGLDDFGGGDWRDGLDSLVASLNEQRFAPEIAAGFEETLVGSLAARLRMEAWIAANAETFARCTVEGPVMIQGLPRTASTALQNVLAVDPQWRFLRGWESESVYPAPVLEEEANDPRFLREQAFIAQDRTFAGKHIQTAGGPVEDTGLLRLNFGAQEGGLPALSYTAAWRDRSMATTFAYHKRALRFLQSRRPPNRWLLKSPPLCFHLDELVATYPDAPFVMTHRDPVQIIPSVCSLTLTRFRTFLPDAAIDPHELGRFFLEHWRIGTARVIEFRRRHGSDRFLDVRHETFNNDPIGEIWRIYAFVGRELTPAAEAAMRGWLDEHRRGARGEHRYTPEEFGMSEGEIREAFREYTDAFGIGA